MRLKNRFYILFKQGLEDQVKWPEGWGNTCQANIPAMLREVLGVQTIGSEMKLIWNYHHERQIIMDYDISYQQLKDYLKARTGMLWFKAKGTRKKAAEALEKMGANYLVFVDDYRDVLLYQAYFENNGRFPSKEEAHGCFHVVTRGREGETGGWCVDCGVKVYEAESRPCAECIFFKRLDEMSYCKKLRMRVSSDMNATYKVKDGSCFE